MDSPPAPVAVALWRPTRGAILTSLAFGLFVCAFGVWLCAQYAVGTEESTAVAALGVMFVGGGSVAGYAFGVRTKLVLTARELEIVNPFSRHRVPLADIREVQAGYSGLCVHTHSALSSKVIYAWAVQRSSPTSSSGDRARADVVARTILAAAEAARAW